MDRTDSRGDFIRSVSAVFLFTGARSPRRNRRNLGVIFLQLCAAEFLHQPRVHARRSVAESGAYRPLFLHPLDCKRAGGISSGRCVGNFVVDLNQVAKCFDWRTASVTRLAKVAMAFSSTTGALAFWSGDAFTCCGLVLACARDRGEVLSASFFWRGRG